MIEEIAGAILGITVLADIFLIVLYARANIGLISRLVSHGMWRLFVWLSRHTGRWRNAVLTLTGPTILVTVLLTWALLLSVAVALIIHPNLGTGVRATSGNTPRDFITALYVGGTSLSFIGASDFTPQTAPFRVLYLLTSLIGLAVVSLTITYLMQLYGDLLDRNAHGLRVHLLSAETGDAAEVIVRLGPHGMFDAGYQILAQWATETVQVKESLGFYDMLFYFRFREAYYSVTRTMLVSLDTVALIKSALDDKEYGWLKLSGALEQLERGAFLELKTLSKLSPANKEFDKPADERTRELWRRRYDMAVEQLQLAGIKTEKSGADLYIALRSQWDPYIKLLAPQFAYHMDEVDTAMAKVS